MDAVLGVMKLAGGFLQARSQKRAGKVKARSIRAMSKYNQRVMQREVELLKQSKDIGLDAVKQIGRESQAKTESALLKSGARATSGTGLEVITENAKRNAKKLNIASTNFNMAIDTAEQKIKGEAYQSEMKAIGAIDAGKSAARSTLISSALGAAGSFSSAYGDMKAYNTENPKATKSFFSF